MLIALQDDNAGPFSDHEPVAVTVIGPRGALRSVIERSGKRPASDEARHANARYWRFGPARHHHLGITERNESRSIPDRMRTCRAGGNHRVVWAPEPVRDRDIPGSKIDQAPRNKKR